VSLVATFATAPPPLLLLLLLLQVELQPGTSDGQYLSELQSTHQCHLSRQLLLLLLQVELQPGTSDGQYLSELHAALAKAAAEFPRPQLIIYNAGEQHSE
jgi:hypothetical protein